MNENIGVIVHSSEAFVNVLFNIWANNDVAVLVDERIPHLSQICLLKMAGVKKCYLPKYEDLEDNSDIEWISYYRIEKSTHVLSKSIYEDFQQNYSNNDAVILFSSGTTGNNKGIVLSHKAINLNADGIIKYLGLEENSVIGIIKSFAHSSALIGELLVGVKTNKKIVILDSNKSMYSVLDDLYLHGVTHLFVNPSIMYLLIRTLENKKISNKISLKKIYISGSKASIHQIKKLKELLPEVSIMQAYGLTELGPRVTAQVNDYPIGSVGKTIEGVDVKIVGNSGEELNIGEIGEIYVKSESVFTRYVTDVEHEKNTTDDGYFPTKDLGYISETKDIYIVGRKDNMINISSHNVYPESIEEFLINSGLISDCVVIGKENIGKGKYLVCYYVASQNVNEELIKKCIFNLPIYERPKKFFKVNQLYYNNNGKVNRRKYEEVE